MPPEGYAKTGMSPFGEEERSQNVVLLTYG